MKLIQYFHSATGWLAIAIFLRLGSGVLLLPLILRYVPEDQLGLWYVFLSLGNAAVIIDLGFSKTAIRSVAALWAGAGQLTAQGVGLADKAVPNYGGVRDLLAAMRLLYFLMALVVAVYLIIADHFLIPWTAENDLTLNSPRFAWYVCRRPSCYIIYSMASTGSRGNRQDASIATIRRSKHSDISRHGYVPASNWV